MTVHVRSKSSRDVTTRGTMIVVVCLSLLTIPLKSALCQESVNLNNAIVNSKSNDALQENEASIDTNTSPTNQKHEFVRSSNEQQNVQQTNRHSIATDPMHRDISDEIVDSNHRVNKKNDFDSTLHLLADGNTIADAVDVISPIVKSDYPQDHHELPSIDEKNSVENDLANTKLEQASINESTQKNENHIQIDLSNLPAGIQKILSGGGSNTNLVSFLNNIIQSATSNGSPLKVLSKSSQANIKHNPVTSTEEDLGPNNDDNTMQANSHRGDQHSSESITDDAENEKVSKDDLQMDFLNENELFSNLLPPQTSLEYYNVSIRNYDLELARLNFSNYHLIYTSTNDYKSAYLVYLYQPWCSLHASVFDILLQLFSEFTGSNVKLALVDLKQDSKLARQDENRNTPALKFYRFGFYYQPRLSRYLGMMKSTINKLLGPPYKVINFYETIIAELTIHPHVVLFFSGSDEAEFEAKIESMGKQYLMGFSFLLTHSAALKEHFQREFSVGEHSLIYFRGCVENHLILPYSGMTPTNITDWLVHHRQLPIVELEEPSADIINQQKIPVLIVHVDYRECFKYVDDDGNIQGPSVECPNIYQHPYVQELKGLSLKYRGKLGFYVINREKFHHFASRLGIEGMQQSLSIVDLEKDFHRSWTMPKFNKRAVEEIIESFLSESIESMQFSLIQSSERGKNETKGDLQEIDNKTLENMLVDPSKSVLVLFYNPACAFAKSIAPIYNKLATTLKRVANITVARIDVRFEDPPAALNITHVPEIVLFPPNQHHSPLFFDGDRSHYRILQFVLRHVPSRLPQRYWDRAQSEQKG